MTLPPPPQQPSPSTPPPPSAPPPYAPPPPQGQYYSPPAQPAGPAPGVRYGGAGGRLVAYIIDSVIIGFVVGLFYLVGILVIAGGTTVDDAGNLTFGAGAGVGSLIFLLGIVVGLLWKPWFWSHGGQTPGYKILRLRLVRAADGGPLSFGTAILRLIGYAVSAMVFYLGFIWILFDSQRQGWHDKIAGTVVIEA